MGIAYVVKKSLDRNFLDSPVCLVALGEAIFYHVAENIPRINRAYWNGGGRSKILKSYWAAILDLKAHYLLYCPFVFILFLPWGHFMEHDILQNILQVFIYYILWNMLSFTLSEFQSQQVFFFVLYNGASTEMLINVLLSSSSRSNAKK